MPARCLLSAMAFTVALLGVRAGWASDTNISAPPGSQASPNLPPGEEEDVRRLLRAAESLRQKADELRVRADALQDRNKDEGASDLEERADYLDDKARQFEDEADQLLRGGEKARPRAAPGHRSHH